MKKDVTTIIYKILMVIGVFFLLLVIFYQKPFKTMVEDDGKPMKLNITDIRRNDKSVTYRFTLPDMKNRNYLGFETQHKEVKVYVDYELVYEYACSSGSISKSPGYSFNFVRMSEEYIGKEIEIVLTSPYKIKAGDKTDFYCGSYGDLRLFVIRGSVGEFVIGLIILLMGIIILAYYFIIKHSADIDKNLLYLGCFALSMGLWSMNETQMANIILNNGVFSMYFAHLALMPLSIQFILFLREYYKLDDDRLWNTSFICSVSVMCINMLLQISGLADFKETIVLTHISIIYAVIVGAIQTARKIKIDRNSKTIRINFFCLIIVVGCYVTDIVSYYMGTSDGNRFGRFGFLIYIIALGVDAMSNSVDLIRMGKKTNMYKKLAYVDALTGVKNRAAYDMAVKRLKDKNQMENKAIVMFDLNNLKKCNDYYGHETGDRYIETIGNCINKIFKNAGTAYRIGGDEFCVIISNTKETNIQESIDMLNKDIDTLREKEEYEYMSVACGYAIFDKVFDSDIDDTRDRADKLMYINKDNYKKTKLH